MGVMGTSGIAVTKTSTRGVSTSGMSTSGMSTCGMRPRRVGSVFVLVKDVLDLGLDLINGARHVEVDVKVKLGWY
jgi:hypothetical protein